MSDGDEMTDEEVMRARALDIWRAFYTRNYTHAADRRRSLGLQFSKATTWKDETSPELWRKILDNIGRSIAHNL